MGRFGDPLSHIRFNSKYSNWAIQKRASSSLWHIYTWLVVLWWLLSSIWAFDLTRQERLLFFYRLVSANFGQRSKPCIGLMLHGSKIIQRICGVNITILTGRNDERSKLFAQPDIRSWFSKKKKCNENSKRVASCIKLGYQEKEWGLGQIYGLCWH